MRRLLAVLLVFAGCRPTAAATDQATVEHVVDGDTIDVRIGDRLERVRLLGIDTPEVYVDRGPPDCFGPEASAFTKTLLPGGTAVRLERDVVGRDDYGRLLAYVYLAADGSLVNETIVRQGFARPLTIAPNGVFAGRLVA